MKDKPIFKENFSVEDTLLNFVFIFRGTLEQFEDIKAYILNSGASLVYQQKSADKIFVTKEGSAQ